MTIGDDTTMRKCPLCGGNPKWIYHAVPRSENPEAWEETDEGQFEPILLVKHIECTSCHAISGFSIQCDEVKEMWNERMPLQYIGEESVSLEEDKS